jgi:hypothetical protein
MYDPGMNRSNLPSNNDYTDSIVTTPAFTSHRIWEEALGHEIRSDTVAVIWYDKNGYSFRIDDTAIDFLFDFSGELIKEK